MPAATTLYLRSGGDEAIAALAAGWDNSAEAASMSAIGPSNQPLSSLLTDVQPNPYAGVLAAQNALQAAVQQRVMLAKFVSHALAVTDIPAMTWSFAFAGYVASAGMNAYFDPVVYTKRTSDGVITGRIFDSDVNVGPVLGSSGHTRGKVGSFAGAHITGLTAADDRIVLELWVRVFPAAVPVANPIVAAGYDGATVISNNVRVDAPAAFISMPIASPFVTDVQGSVSSAAHGATSFSEASVVPQVSRASAAVGATSLAVPFIGSLVNVASAGHGITSVTARIGSAGSGVTTDDYSENCWGAAQPWLRYGGVEIANLGRMRSYAEQAAAGIVQWGCPPNDIVFRANGLPDYFVSPASDPAPWYDPAYPESADFLGVCLEPAIDVPWDRANTALIRRGAALGPLRMKERTLVANGFMMALSKRGMEYGKRWLLSRTSGCPDCSHGADLEMYLSSPPVDGSNDEVGRWALRRCGIQAVDVDDTETPIADCKLVFTVGDPLLYKTPSQLVPFAVLPYLNVPVSTGGFGGDHQCIAFVDWFCGTPDPSLVAPIDPPPFGELATVLTVDATADAINGIVVEVLSDCQDESSVIAQATIGQLELGSVFVMDSAREQVTYYRADGSIEDGSSVLDIPDGVAMPWLSVSWCDPAKCLAVRRARYCSRGANTQMQVETVLRAA